MEKESEKGWNGSSAVFMSDDFYRLQRKVEMDPLQSIEVITHEDSINPSKSAVI